MMVSMLSDKLRITLEPRVGDLNVIETEKEDQKVTRDHGALRDMPPCSILVVSCCATGRLDHVGSHHHGSCPDVFRHGRALQYRSSNQDVKLEQLYTRQVQSASVQGVDQIGSSSPIFSTSADGNVRVTASFPLPMVYSVRRSGFD